MSRASRLAHPVLSGDTVHALHMAHVYHELVLMIEDPGGWAIKTKVLADLAISDEKKGAAAVARTYTWSLGEQQDETRDDVFA